MNTTDSILARQREAAAAFTRPVLDTKVVVERIDTTSGEFVVVESDGALSLSRSLDMAAEFNRLATSVGYYPDTRVYVVDRESGERVEVTR